MVKLLDRNGFFPLTDVTILDVGCGSGGWLVDFDVWGARQPNLAGVDVDPVRAADARQRLPLADIRAGDGHTLPWPDASFDLVVQATVFTSILDPGVRRALAGEMARVLAPGGAVLWYDFFRENPSNPDVRAVRADEIRELFPGFDVSLRRITLAPPLSRLIARRAWTAATLLEGLRVLNTHYLGLLRRA
jgi:ubiquinone/menaquinone biosynthesis C-methylase UbiE